MSDKKTENMAAGTIGDVLNAAMEKKEAEKAPTTIDEVKDSKKEVTPADTATVLKKAEDTSKSAVTIKKKDEERKEAQQAELDKAVKNSVIPDRVEKRTKADRASGKIKTNLDAYANEPIGSIAKITALQKAIETVLQHPTRSNFDTIYAFFQEHKNDAFLKEENALQNIVILSADIRIKVEMLYHILYSLAHGTASRKNISLNTIRNVFGSDELVNWVTLAIRRR